MNEPKQQVPNALTSANLLLGCLAIIAALNGNLSISAWYIVGAGVLDFFDGFVARALDAQSELGKQLDSLADVVSFGVAPGMVWYMYAGQCIDQNGFCITPYIALLIPVFSAIRLATFNLDTRQSDGFIGLPTPANALLFISIPYISADFPEWTPLLKNSIFLRLMPILAAYLLTSEIPMMAFKFKSWNWKDNAIKYLFVALGSGLIVIFGFSGIGFFIFAYILFSVLTHLISRKSI